MTCAKVTDGIEDTADTGWSKPHDLIELSKLVIVMKNGLRYRKISEGKHHHKKHIDYDPCDGAFLRWFLIGKTVIKIHRQFAL